jgi:hypothetical protein
VHDPAVVTSAEVNVAPGQLSETVGVEKISASVQFIVDGPLTPLITGAWLSVTVTVNDLVSDPQQLEAVTDTVVMPLLKVAPLPVPEVLAVVVAPLVVYV